jgi:hypothetical protein
MDQQTFVQQITFAGISVGRTTPSLEKFSAALVAGRHVQRLSAVSRLDRHQRLQARCDIVSGEAPARRVSVVQRLHLDQ